VPRAARLRDRPAILALLQRCGLPVAGVRAWLGGFLVAEEGGKLIGCIGLEERGRFGLLRSAAVDAAERGRGIGVSLVEALLARARAQQLRSVYLLTTSAPRFFARFGFRPVERSAVPPELRRSIEFRGACPTSALVMRLPVGHARKARAARPRHANRRPPG
jgi:amino-acid N-acetyltransferase